MNTSAFIMMITTITIVTVVTVYFFVKVYTMPSKPEPDSYSDNDPRP
jgi:hypothetical protein